MNHSLFNTSMSFDGNTYRNIPEIHGDIDPFDDLTTNSAARKQAHSISKASKILDMETHQIRDYNKAIGYGFNLRRWSPSRFGDGSFYVWYGCKKPETTIYETCYHWYQRFLNDCNYFDTSTTIIAQRSIYKVQLTGILIDMRKKSDSFPDLIQPDMKRYGKTQILGNRVQSEGQPGILTCSARDKKGENFAVFKQRILHDPSYYEFLEYQLQPTKGVIEVCNDSGDVILEI